MSDLIDRQKVIEALQKGRPIWKDGDDYQYGRASQWTSDIMAIESVPTESRWIPCSERLPESDGYYLVTNSKWGAPWREITLWMTDGWSSNNEPIAWMSLPEPWKGEEDGGTD